MDEQDSKPPDEPQGGPPLGTDDADVRVAIEQTRQALEPAVCGAVKRNTKSR